MASPTRELILNNPTHLFVGQVGAVSNAVVSLLQQILCSRNGCGYCAVCHGIYNHSSAQLLWLEPENNFTREAIQPIFNTIALQRAEGECFFIVIAQAERLQHATANSLLKSLEEPPQGYYFLLMTSHERLVLPTIRSRCIVHADFAADDLPVRDNALYKHFTGLAPLNPVQFLQLLDQLDLSDQESTELFDLILHGIQRACINKETKNVTVLSDMSQKLKVFIHATSLLPQSGSSKVFWKNLYLQTISYQMERA